MNVCISKRHKREMQTAVIYPFVLLLLLIPVFYSLCRFPARYPVIRKTPHIFGASAKHQKKTRDEWYVADCYTTQPQPAYKRHSILTDLLLIQTALPFFSKAKFQDLPTSAKIKPSGQSRSNRSLRAPPKISQTRTE